MSWMDTCRYPLEWQVWLLLCSSVVVLWAAAVAGAIALFSLSPRLNSADGALRRDTLTPPARGSADDADVIHTDRPN